MKKFLTVIAAILVAPTAAAVTLVVFDGVEEIKARRAARKIASDNSK